MKNSLEAQILLTLFIMSIVCVCVCVCVNVYLTIMCQLCQMSLLFRIAMTERMRARKMFVQDKHLVTNLQSSLLYAHTVFVVCYHVIAMGNHSF